MIIKLAKNGMKGRLSDYFTLFSGLSISVAVMYLFLTLALNRDFITQNSVINSIQLVFLVGAILLAVITFFYVLFAHSFLLSLRKKEFGAYLLMGVKRKQIKRIARIELLVVAVSSNVIGMLIGTGLAVVVSALIETQLNLTLTGFHAFYAPALFGTLLYYAFAFFLSACWNHRKIMKTPILAFLYAELTSDEAPQKKKNSILVTGFGSLFLILGYGCLIWMEQLREIGLFTAAISTTLGTYMLFSSFLPFYIHTMKRSKKWYLRGLSIFTFSQLHFRMHELKRVLATVAMLIALSAGAIAAGFAFLNNAELIAEESSYYDMRLFNPTQEEIEILKDITFLEKETYHVKMDKDRFYYSLKELTEKPPMIKDEVTDEMRPAQGLEATSVLELDQWEQQQYPDDWYSALYHITPSAFKWTMLLSEEAYQALALEEYQITIGKTDNFLQYEAKWQTLDALQKTQYALFGAENEDYYYNSKYNTHQDYYAFASGTFFMGFFLGIAFLMMMASVLMFKVLSNAQKDRHRYNMLKKLGVKRHDLLKSLQKELALIFFFPGVLGLLHVLIGMNLFSFIMLEPYDQLWVSILLFLGIYVLYYVITYIMYKKIVLPKPKTRS